ncbi:MAG TPA: class I SAM-dependent methyltransferase, partial [Polyangia bacterium]
LAALGHDPNRPTLTIWEGVTMYLTEPAIDATVTAVRRLSAPESRLAFTYFDRAMLTRPNVRMRLAGRAVARLGEPFRFGWDPGGLESWLAERELTLVEDRTVDAYARALLPARWARRVADRGRHIAIARPR